MSVTTVERIMKHNRPVLVTKGEEHSLLFPWTPLHHLMSVPADAKGARAQRTNAEMDEGSGSEYTPSALAGFEEEEIQASGKKAPWISRGAPTTLKDAAEALDAEAVNAAMEESSDSEEDILLPNNDRINFRTLTHSAIGKENSPLPKTNIFAAKSRKYWLHDSQKGGYAAILYANMKTLDDEPGYAVSWWVKNKKKVKRSLVKTPIENVQSAGIFTATEGLSESSLLTSVMCTVAELIGSNDNDKYCISTPQLFLPSTGGFCQEFRTDNGVPPKSYRCFWYLAPKNPGVLAEYPELTDPEREAVFVGSGGECMKSFSDQRVMTLAGYYGEADRKFRLHPGDILVMSSRFAFAVDLPVGGRAQGSRILSWIVIPDDGRTSHPMNAQVPETVVRIDQLAQKCAEAKKYYEKEMHKFSKEPGSIGDPESHMQRLRVTPKIYVDHLICEEVKK